MSNLACICRPEFEHDITAQLISEHGVAGADCQAFGNGIVAISSAPHNLPPLLFERQRLPDYKVIPFDQLKPISSSIADRVFGPVIDSSKLWTLHTFTSPNLNDPKNSKRLPGIAANLERVAAKKDKSFRKRFRPFQRLKYDDGLVLQICLTDEGILHSTAPREHLTSSFPGGIYRMKDDPLAPSRSYLKMEEALFRLGIEPQAGDRVVDLGAAPGGWSYAFLKRGCEVIAIDHGPMSIPDSFADRFHHIRTNGITYHPDDVASGVKWLVGDMLIAPGIVLGILRRWMKIDSLRVIIMNMKLPQHDAYDTVVPMLAFLEEQSKWRSKVTQLYHDRREVTVMSVRKET